MMKLFKILSSAALLCVIGALLGSFPTTAGSVKADQPDSVIVTNTPLPVQGTVAATQSGPWNVGSDGACDIFNDIGPVPNGKVLVIEDYSGECVVPNGTLVTSAGFQLLHPPDVGGGSTITNVVHGPVTLAGGLLPGKTEYTFGRSTKVYAIAGSTISPDMGVPPGTTAGGCDLAVNGYFVNQ